MMGLAPVEVAATQLPRVWNELVYLKQQQATYDQATLRRIVKEILAPGLRRAAPR